MPIRRIEPSDWIEKRPFENGLFSWLPLLGSNQTTSVWLCQTLRLSRPEGGKVAMCANKLRQDGVKERAQQGKRQLNKSRQRRVYHQFRKELHIIKAERFVYHHCESHCSALTQTALSTKTLLQPQALFELLPHPN